MTTPRARPRPRRHRGGRGATIALGAVVALVAVASAPRPAAAFQIESPATAPCHEELTVAAVVAAGFPDRDVAPAPTEDQARAMDDLTFRLPRRDVWTLALLIGVRSNDLRGFSPIDVSALVSVHDDPDDQQAHCLRGPDDDEPGGDLGALAACRAFILDELAAGGLLDDDLDLAATEAVEVFLAFRGRIALDLPRFAYRLGRALHAVEDGYSHTFRDPGGGEVTHVLNWIDHADGHGDAGRDGYHHVGALDDCRRDDGRTRRRVQRATDAAAALVAAIGDPAPGRRARVEAAVDAALAARAGCDAGNRYCDAEELDEEATYGCAIAGGSSAFMIVAVGLFVVRRRRRGLTARTGAAAAAALLALGLAAAPSPAAADDHGHLDARLAASNDEPSVAMVTAAGVDRGRYTVGLAIEWNPWFSISARRAVAGTFDAYVTVSRRWYVRPELSLYSRVELGTSTILFPTVGVDRYSTGIYAGAVFLGVRIPLRPGLDLTLDPSHLAMPIPALTGIPYYYGQWRFDVGVEARL